MNPDNREIEVKFKINSAEEFIPVIRKNGAICEQQTRFERNLRWDDSEERLSKSKQVLRLRDNGGTAVLTYKSDRNSTEELADREEIETVVSDFNNTELILKRLGFEVFFIYEKYRSIYSLDETGIFVDHTPIGDYIEIEGPDEDAIRITAEKLGLDWNARIGKGYKALFNIWKKQTAYPGRDMVFDEIGSSGQNA